MEKQISINYGGQTAKVADLLVNRLLPNRYITAVGPFVFLDHIFPVKKKKQEPEPYTASHAHPHRGIATFSYVFSGELEHFDSYGNHGIVQAGGAQWMKAGNGIVHDERLSPAFQLQGGEFHSLQFWINLPAKNKAEAPEYLAIKSSEIPETDLPEEAGTLRVVIGNCGEMVSPVKTFSRQFIYHIRLNPKSGYTLQSKPGLEYAAFVPKEEIIINNKPFGKSEFISFEEVGDEISLHNPGIEVADIIIFGGELYTEPIYAEGPFVMNSRLEIAHAYRDFFKGNYGTIAVKQ